MVEQHKKALEKQLWNIANALRGNMSADEFRDYILGFIFYKYLSERMDIYADELLKEDGIKFDAIDENTDEGKEYLEAIQEEAIDHLGYFLKPSELFHVLAQKGENGEFILEALSEVLNHIEQSTMGTASEDDFNGLFDDLDLTSNKLGKTEKAKNDLISKILVHLDDIDFLHHETEIDVLGDAYEYLIGQFASGAGKKAGEFYTPPMVSKLLAKLVTMGKDKLHNVYDPTCGSGSLLLRVAKEVKEVGNYYGQESNPSTYNLARMNMILHGVHYRQFDIQQDDTLEQPHHIEKRFEAVVANPPFSAKWSAATGFLSDERFQDYGKLAPKGKADFAFVLHMLHQLSDNGTMAVVLPHGVLFRGAAEGHIRKHLIEHKNCLDAVIGLPENIFYGTSISTCILILKKNRKNTDNIHFIDASAFFEKAANQNFLREGDIEKILSAVKEQSFIKGYSELASIEKIKENDFNLNIPRYVDTYKEEEIGNVDDICKALKSRADEFYDIDRELTDTCEHLGIVQPRGNNLVLLKQYKKSVLHKLLSQEVRFASKNSELPDWQDFRLNEIAKIYDGTHSTPNYVQQGVPFYSVEQITRNDFSNTKFISEEVFEKESKRVIIERGDILMTRIGDVGSVKFLDWDVRASFYVSLALIKLDKEYCGKFISQYIQGASFQRELYKRTIHVAFPKKINLGEIGLCKLTLPCIEEQQYIADFLTLLDRKIKIVEEYK